MTNAMLAITPIGMRNMSSVPKSQLYDPLIRALEKWILSDPVRKQDFDTAVQTAQSHNIVGLEDIESLEDYLQFINDLLHWIPSEAIRPRDLLFRLAATWFVLDQPSVIQYQSPVRPAFGAENQAGQLQDISWLSRWMVRYCNQFGKFMDTPESAMALDTFKSNPTYNIEDYIEPRGGWKTYNEFFARHVKPGRRPIVSIGDNRVVTSPADAEFKAMHPITANSTVTTKGLTWPVAQLLAGSPYQDRFANGVWLHAFLNVDDYHRLHTPVAGTVVEARTIQGHSYMQVEAAPVHGINGEMNMQLTIPNEAGYQFCQSRGLVIIDTGLGLVAVLPVGMAIVSSVILTAEIGAELHKGEELGYFQFGGSDVVLMFESKLDVRISMEEGRHYRMGREIGRFGLARE